MQDHRKSGRTNVKTAGPGLPGPFLSRRYAAKAKTLVHVVARKLLTAKQVIDLLPRGDRSGYSAAMLFRSETVSYDVPIAAYGELALDQSAA